MPLDRTFGLVSPAAAPVVEMKIYRDRSLDNLLRANVMEQPLAQAVRCIARRPCRQEQSAVGAAGGPSLPRLP